MNFIVSIIALTGVLCCVSVAEGFNYTILGCYADKKRPKAIASLEGTSELLDGKHWQRENAIEKCAEVAHSLNYTIFAVSRGGKCLGDDEMNFFMHGTSDNCEGDGKGARRPPAMDVYEITADTCPELEVDCYGDCCNQTWSMGMRQDGQFTTGNEMRCSGYWDQDTGCQLGADYCVPYEYDNYMNYAKELGAPELCYGRCDYPCNWPEEISCWNHGDGCGYPYCLHVGNSNFTDQEPAVRQFMNGNGDDTCYDVCPTKCSQFDLECDSGYDQNGCWMGGYCIPVATNNGAGGKCPGVCYTPCDWAAGETSCPSFTEDGCFAGNTCEMPDARSACEEPAVRMDSEDELMLRSGSQHSIAAFYKKLAEKAKK